VSASENSQRKSQTIYKFEGCRKKECTEKSGISVIVVFSYFKKYLYNII